MVWEVLATANDCWTWSAALKLALPAWLASTTHVPTPVKETVDSLIEQTELAVESMVKVTGLPDAPPVAVESESDNSLDDQEDSGYGFSTAKQICAAGTFDGRPARSEM